MLHSNAHDTISHVATGITSPRHHVSHFSLAVAVETQVRMMLCVPSGFQGESGPSPGRAAGLP